MKKWVILLLIAGVPVNVFSGELRIACAANFILPMKEISEAFEKEENIKIVNSFGSTGILYGQIKNKAPFDIFFAADLKRPELLKEAGLAEDTFIYARGRAVLWTKSEEVKKADNYKDALEKSVKVSVALPKAAPYGKIVTDLLQKEGVLKKFNGKMVFGKNVAQSFQYAYSGFTDSGFCALSQALSDKGKEGKHFILKDSKDIIQGGCILDNNKTANEFINYLVSRKDVLEKYGYKAAGKL
jgi:molybdate transport system substrate-binding protein